MHKIRTAQPIAAAFGIFWNYRGRLVPCEAYIMGADGCPTSGDDATPQELADAFERGATFLTYESFLTLEEAEARTVEIGENYTVRPLPAGWFFYIGEQLCVVAPAGEAKAADHGPVADARAGIIEALGGAHASPAMAWIVARTQAHLHVGGNYSGISVHLTSCRPDDALIAAMNLPPLPKIGARR